MLMLLEDIEPIVSSALKYSVVERNLRKPRKMDLLRHRREVQRCFENLGTTRRRTEVVRAAKQQQKFEKMT